MPVAVLGAGSFGTCLALLCAGRHDVTLWARDPEIADAINRERRNPRYLDDVELPASVRATASLDEALAGRELVICAVPSHGVRDVMTRAAPMLSDEAILVSTVKGIEVDTCMRMDQVLEDVLDAVHHPRLAFLSGPSFAREIADVDNHESNPRWAPLRDGRRARLHQIQSIKSKPLSGARCQSTSPVVRAREKSGALASRG